MENIITLKNIDYSYYGKITALKDISLSVKRGEMFSIIGLNGTELIDHGVEGFIPGNGFELALLA